MVSRSKMHADADFVPMLVSFLHDVVDLVRQGWAGLAVTRLLVSFTQFLILRGPARSGGPRAQTSFLVAFGGWAVAQIGIMIPITPGGLGTVDAFLIALLTAMGVSEGDTTVADLVWRQRPAYSRSSSASHAWWRGAGAPSRTFAAARPAD